MRHLGIIPKCRIFCCPGDTMPWRIEQRDGRYCVVKESDNSVEKCHRKREDAVAHMSALYASEKGDGKMLQFGMPIKVDDIKTQGDTWEVAGYSSTFGNVDLGNDMVMPGAFKRWLAMWEKGKVKTRFLHSHHPLMVLGVPIEMREEKKGLLVRNKISKTTLGKDTRIHLDDGALDSFSIGYIPRDYEYDEKGGVRLLKDLDLLENSLVAMPMNTEAVVTSVKSYLMALGISVEQIDELEGSGSNTITNTSSGISFGDESLTLAEKGRQLNEALSQFIGDTRALVDGIDRPLTHKKRQELQELLELCSGLDAVRSDLQTVLQPAPSLVNAKRIHYELADRRKRLAHILRE